MLQLLRYMVRIWDKEIAQNIGLKTLPAIVPVVFYHGTRRWKLPLVFASYVEQQDVMESHIPDFRAVMFDL